MYHFTGYESKAHALKDLNTLIDNGFPDAHIVEKQASNQKDPILEQTSGEFTIQIKALKVEISPKEFTKLEGVKTYKGKDGFYRYTYGEFATREEAVNAWAEITKQDLVKDAFIVLIKNLKKY